jgi:ring-1,2-phenylacetyl-CoA epoxidase subunit PaaE
MQQLTLTISGIFDQPNDVRIFILQSETPVFFIPGQFLSLEFILNGKSIRRSYSLCNSPYLDEPLTIAVKQVENGEISRLLHHHYKIGDTLIAYQPAGLFQYQYQTETARDILLIGAGSGITPLLSILKSALLKELQSTVTLIYSNHSPETTLFYEEIQDLREKYPTRFNCIFLWSNTKNLHFARLNRELLEKLVGQYINHPQDQALIYTCGPFDYMLMCRIVLTGLGYTADQLKRETFNLPEDEGDDDDETLASAAIIDKETYTIQLNYRQQEYKLTIPYPKTILDVALENKIDLPYSCQAGMCGTCSAQCTEGNILMQYNEVLTDKEVNQGKVLLCTAHPLGNDVKIQA